MERDPRIPSESYKQTSFHEVRADKHKVNDLYHAVRQRDLSTKLWQN
jgi:hypothetical protein